MRDISTELVAIYITADGRKFLKEKDAKKHQSRLLYIKDQDLFLIERENID